MAGALRAFFRRRPLPSFFLLPSSLSITLDSFFPSRIHPQTTHNHPVVAAMLSLNLFESIAAFFRPASPTAPEGATCSSPASSSSKGCPAVTQLQSKQDAIKPVLCRRYVYFNARAQKSDQSSVTTSTSATTTAGTTTTSTETAATTSRSLLCRDRSVHR